MATFYITITSFQDTRGAAPINNEQTQVLVEQAAAVAPGRLGEFVGRVSHEELTLINDALRLALELD